MKKKTKVNPNQEEGNSTTPGQTPNILLIIADDLGQDVVSIKGSGRMRTMRVHTNDGKDEISGALPNISRFLRNGLYFSQAWAQPACSTTRASIFTGLHPWKNGVGSPPGELDSLAGFITLPTLLPDHYVSGLFGKWHLGKKKNFWPTDHGWQRHIGTLEGKLNEFPHTDYEHWYMADSDTDYEVDKDGIVGTQTEQYATWVTVAMAAKWINEQDANTPWFATIAFHSPHEPFHIPPDADSYDPTTAGKTTESDAYKFNLMAQNMDYNIGRLLGTSGTKGDPYYFESIPESQLSNTIILFIGDNGSAEKIAFAEPKNWIYEGSVRVPMIIADGQAVMNEFKGQAATPRYLYPSRLNATCDLLAHVVDIYKTIVRLANPDTSRIPDNTDSIDFSDVLTDPFFALDANTLQKRTFNFSQYYKDSTRRATIRTTGYKLNYEGSADPKQEPKWALYQYSGGEIPGREDEEDPVADDVFAARLALSKRTRGGESQLDVLLDHLIANYSSDYDPDPEKKYPFPDPRL
jgi:arylsulfatase A-like enzyme